MEFFSEGSGHKKIRPTELAMPDLPSTDARVAAGHRAQAARHGVRKGLAQIAKETAPADEHPDLTDFGRVQDASAIVHHRMARIYSKEAKDK